MSHTPGPWHSKDWMVCNDFSDTNPIKVISWTGNNKASRTEENKANAVLIAAAPELLAVLGELKTWLIAPSMDEDEIQAFRELIDSTIAKATNPPA